MTRIIVLFNLKPDADPAEYEQWARNMDLPQVRRLPGVRSFDIFRTAGLLTGEPTAPYQFVEVIEVDDFNAFTGALGGEQVQALAAQFNTFADNPIFMVADPL